MVDASGSVTSTITYEIFGTLLTETSASATGRLGYQGLVQVRDAKLLQTDHRILGTTIAKFLHQDPRRWDAEDWNLYREMGNNPTNLTDPSGLDPNQAEIALLKMQIDPILEKQRTGIKLTGQEQALLKKWIDLQAYLSAAGYDSQGRKRRYERPLEPTFEGPNKAGYHLTLMQLYWLEANLRDLADAIHPAPKNLADLKKLQQSGVTVREESYGTLERFHPGAYYGFRIYDRKKDTLSGNQATYDSNGDLITMGAAAGTPDVISPEAARTLGIPSLEAFINHFYFDVGTFRGMGWQKYHVAGWAPVNAVGARPNKGQDPTLVKKWHQEERDGERESLWKKMD